jgi:hypothetical protein
MGHLRSRTSWRIALLVGIGLLPVPAFAVSLISSTRSIDLGGPPTTRTTPGAFVSTLSNGNSNSSSGSSQDTSVSLTATLVKLVGNGGTTAQQATTLTSSQRHDSNSFLDASFSLLSDSPYVLSGILTKTAAVPLGGSPQFDNSTVSIVLDEVGGPTLFSFSSNGSYSKNGTLTGGKTYHLRIESDLSLQTKEIFNKTNGWTVDFIASDVPVPEPTAFLLAAIGFAACCASRRRA